MVLVDTSVWVRFLSNRAPYAAELDRLLALCGAAGHDLIYGELLIGDHRGREEFLKSYNLLHRLPCLAHTDVVAFVQAHRLHGKGIGWVDAHLLASAMICDATLWTADSRLARLATTFGLGYDPTVTATPD